MSLPPFIPQHRENYENDAEDAEPVYLDIETRNAAHTLTAINATAATAATTDINEKSTTAVDEPLVRLILECDTYVDIGFASDEGLQHQPPPAAAAAAVALNFNTDVSRIWL